MNTHNCGTPPLATIWNKAEKILQDKEWKRVRTAARQRESLSGCRVTAGLLNEGAFDRWRPMFRSFADFREELELLKYVNAGVRSVNGAEAIAALWRSR